MIDTLALFLVMAVTVEALVEYGQCLLAHENRRALALQVASLVLGVALCCLAGIDIYARLGVTLNAPFLGCALTGVFASRGANWASDILARLQGSISG